MATLSFGYSTDAVKTASDYMIDGGPIIDVFIRPYSTQPLNPAATPVQAMLDTGGGVNGIDATFISNMGLTPIDKKDIAGISGIITVEFYLLQVFVPALNYSKLGRFAALDLRGQLRPYTVLLGRRFLSKFKLTVDGPSGTGQLDG